MPSKMKADPALPVRDTLLDPKSAATVLDAVLAEVGARCGSVRPTQVRYLPESSISVRYQVNVTWRDGSSAQKILVAMAGRKLPNGTPIVEVEGSDVAVWSYPHDPLLPGLAAISRPKAVAEILDQLGAPGNGAATRTRVYRPGRRAVVEVRGPQTRVFIKVVRPAKARSLQETHKTIAGAVPVPHSLGWTEELGLVALQAMEGQTLRNAVEGDWLHRPTGAELFALVGALPELPSGRKRVLGPIGRAKDHANLISHVQVDLEERVSGLVESLGPPSTPIATVHGDFHSAQILVDEQGVAGLIDVDSAGIGDPADDMAMMLAHMSTLATGSHGSRFAAYGRKLLDDLDRMLDPSDLRRRVAAACLGFATGAFRVQMSDWRAETLRRVRLAEEWAASA